MERSVILRISGRVQGVGFRYSAQARAESLNIKGLAKNMPDGSVYVEAAGEKENIESFIQWCRQGPPLARVQDVTVEDGEVLKRNSFVIR